MFVGTDTDDTIERSQARSLGLVGMTQSRLRVAATRYTVVLVMMSSRWGMGMTRFMQEMGMM